MPIDTTGLEGRGIQHGALLPVVVVGHVQASLLNQDEDQVLVTDEITGTLAMIDIVHHEVHEGEMFHAEYMWTSVANNNSADMLLVTGIKYPHLVFNVNAGGACYVYLYEQCTTSGNGTALPVYNMKRYVADAALTAVFHTPSMSTLGFELVGRYLPGGTQVQSRVGGGVRNQSEWIVKPSTKYLMRVTNKSGSAIALSIAVEFYEESEP